MKYYAMLEDNDVILPGDEIGYATSSDSGFGSIVWKPAPGWMYNYHISVFVEREWVRRPINIDEMIHNSLGKTETKATGRKITLHGSTVRRKNDKKAV
jgi:hypothetical protein